MKSDKAHRVPPVAATTKLLKAQVGQNAIYVFPGAKEGKPFSTMAMLMMLRRIRRDDLTAHGFRLTFRDWAAEETEYPSEMAEIALAHTFGTNGGPWLRQTRQPRFHIQIQRGFLGIS